jgi:two-component system, NarL family, sensor histidine kinase UhpB
MRDAVRVTTSTGLPLFWRVCLINGLVFAAGTAAFVFSPATVSSQVVVSEAVVLVVGLIVILITNALLLRTSLAPLDRLMRLMESVDLLLPGQRLPESGNGAVAHLVHTFNAMLERLESERGASSAHALAATEAERQRIAQELHDEIGQGLTAVLLGLKRAVDRAPQDLAEELRTIQETARASLDEVRSVAKRLRPGVLDDLGLLSALTSLATDFSTHTGVPVRREYGPELPDLSHEAELVIYRVAQEGMTNAARHATATSVGLSLTRQGNSAVLCVVDNGTGMHGHAEGAGIRGMRERAILVRAQFSIGPRKDGGTEVRLAVPDRHSHAS